MKARTVAIIVLLLVAAAFGGYALHGGLGHGTASAASAGNAGSSSFAGGARSGATNGGRAAAFGGGGFGGARSSGGFAGRSATVTVQAVKVASGPLVAQRSATGTVVPVMQSNVAAQASGTVKTLMVAVGDDVKAGQPIVQLNTDTLELAVANARTQLSTAEINLQTQQTNTQQAATQLQSQLASAQAALSAAQANYVSAQKVYALGGTSQTSVDSARSQLAQAQANVTSAQNGVSQNQRAESESLQQLKLAVAQAQNGVKQAELNLANATIRAPFAGQVASFAIAPGEYVGPSTSVATLVSAQRQVQLTVPPSDASAFTAGTKLTFSTGVAQFPMTVGQRPGAPVNQGVTVTAKFDPPSGAAADLPAIGVVGTVSYKVTLATATLVPISAIQNDGTTTFVYVIQAGKTVQTDVTMLAQAGNEAAVTGVPAGVTIVDQPPPGLLNGAPVEVAGASGSSGTSAAGGSARTGAGASGSTAGSNAGGTQRSGFGSGARGRAGSGSAPSGATGTGGAATGGTRGGFTPGGAAGGSGRTSGGTSTPSGAPGGFTRGSAGGGG